MINKTTKSPIEFDARGIIDEQYVRDNNLMQSAMIGLNPTVLKRYATVRQLTPAASPAPPGVKIIPIKEGGKWLVLETLDGGATWRQIQNESGDVSIFLEGVNTRCEDYNKIQAADIFTNRADADSARILGQYQEGKRQSSPAGIKQQVMDDLIDVFEKKLARALPASSAGFRKVAQINEEAISGIIINRVAPIKSINESLLSHIIRLDDIINQFARELTKKINAYQIADNIFRDKRGGDLRAYLVTGFKYIVQGTVHEMDRSRWTEVDTTLKDYYFLAKAASSF